MTHLKVLRIQQRDSFTTTSLAGALLRFKPEKQITSRRADRDAIDSLIAVHLATVINPIGRGEVAIGLERKTVAG